MGRRRSPSKGSYHKKAVRAARRNAPPSPDASVVTVRKADTGEIVDRLEPYEAERLEQIVTNGKRAGRFTSPNRTVKMR